MARTPRSITVRAVGSLPASAAEAVALRDTLGLLVERVVLEPESFEATVHFRLSPAEKAGVDWRPHGDSNQSPVFRHQAAVHVRHNRRAA